MKKLLSIVFGLLFIHFLLGQNPNNRNPNDAIDNLNEGNQDDDEVVYGTHDPKITDYLYWTSKDYTKNVIDTTFKIQNLYNQNFTQKDNFGKMYFPNFGQTFNPLVFEAQNSRIQLLPTGKSFNYLAAEDIKYYDVKTPMTEFVYENGLKEGQFLSTTFTQNLSRQFNYFLNYRGLKSEGRYLRNISSNNSFTTGISFKSKLEKLNLWSHFSVQNIDNQENGGIRDLNQFIYDDSLRTTNRQNIFVNLNHTDTEFDSRRFYLGASYRLFGVGLDSVQTKSPLKIKNVFSYEKQKYLHLEHQPEDFFQVETFEDLERRNQKNFESLQNTTTLEFNWGERLWIEAGFRYENIKLYADQTIHQDLTYIPEKVDDQLLGTVANVYFDWNERLKLNGELEFKSGDFFKNQYHVLTELDIQPIKSYHLIGGVLLQSAYPSLNLLYNQSFYKEFNYFNESFQNINTQKVFGKIFLEKFNTELEAAFYNVENYVYVDSDYSPKQLNSNLNLFQIKAQNTISYKKFHLNTAVEFQKVSENAQYLPLPDFIGRVSLYWQSKVFDNKAEMQIGLTGNYFTKFESRSFFPVINEFMLQREDTPFGIQKIGGFPILDFFLNIKVDRMQIFLRADHFNALWGENNYYSAPYTPFRDFKIQIGVKWYLFT